MAVYSIESFVSIFGGYIVGKELGNDIEKALINLSKMGKLRFQALDYLYILERHTTLTSYTIMAKRQRYKKFSLPPGMINFNEQSNSKTVKMFFSKDDFNKLKDNSAHILTINVDPRLIDEFKSESYLLGVKVCLNSDFLGTRKSMELFQALNKNHIGCLDEKDKWYVNSVFYRTTRRMGRLKFFKNSGIIPNVSLINK